MVFSRPLLPPLHQLDPITTVAIMVAVANILFVLWLFSDLVRNQRLDPFAKRSSDSPGILLAMITLILLTLFLIVAVLLEK